MLDDILGLFKKEEGTLQERADNIKRKADEAEKLLSEQTILKEQIKRDKKRYSTANAKLNPLVSYKYYFIIGAIIIVVVLITKLQ